MLYNYYNLHNYAIHINLYKTNDVPKNSPGRKAPRKVALHKCIPGKLPPEFSHQKKCPWENPLFSRNIG